MVWILNACNILLHGKWCDKIINNVAIPLYRTKDDRTFILIDIFHQEGNLLTKYAPLKFCMSFLDDQGKIFIDEEDFGNIFRYGNEIVN